MPCAADTGRSTDERRQTFSRHYGFYCRFSSLMLSCLTLKPSCLNAFTRSSNVLLKVRDPGLSNFDVKRCNIRFGSVTYGGLVR